MIRSARWLGHDFQVFDAPDDETNVWLRTSDWPEAGGLYVFAWLGKDDQAMLVWHSEYIGQTDNLNNRLSTHENWPEAQQRGATHIHIREESDHEKRARLEEKLIQAYQPPMNDDLK